MDMGVSPAGRAPPRGANPPEGGADLRARPQARSEKPPGARSRQQRAAPPPAHTTPPAARQTPAPTPMSIQNTVAGLVLEQLKREGVRTVYGIPGGPATPLFDAFHGNPALRLVSPRHEAGAAFMALGDARVTGRVGVCL